MSSDLIPGLVCKRVFLGMDKPLLQSAVQYTLAHLPTATAEKAPLTDWTFVLPTTQSALRFNQLLSSRLNEDGIAVFAVKTVTAGDLAETLYSPQRPIAIEFEQTLAWTRVLRACESETLRPLLPVLPESDSVASWLELAGTLRRLTADLATHEVTFDDVLVEADTDAERRRWQLLQGLYAGYLDQLKSAGLADPFEQRRRAIAKGTVRAPGPVALIGTSDLNPSIAKLIEAVDKEVIALIAAPESDHSDFDWIGRLRTDSFLGQQLPLSDEQIIAANDIGDQALALGELVHTLSSRHSIDQISIGVTDPSQVVPVEMKLEAMGLQSYRHVGWTVDATAIGKLIRLAAEFVSRRTWRSLAALVRHGEVHRYLRAQLDVGDDDFLVGLDRLLAESFPVALSAELPESAVKQFSQAIALRDKVLDWMSALMGRPKPIGEWCVALREWIGDLYSEFDTEEPVSEERELTRSAYVKVRELLDRFATLNQHLDENVSGGAAMDALSNRLAEIRVGNERKSDQIPIHGWLDLPLNDAEAMIVVGLNHPFVPSAVTSDPFLPGSLRTKLRLADNERRYARDVYAMKQILSARSTADVRFIVGKQSADGSPTPPSRLIAAAPAEDVARRIRVLLDGERTRVELPDRWGPPVKKSELPIPSVKLDECPVKSMSVTAFKSYLECPFRFYLRHVLKLKPIDDASNELAANQFGDLVHGAVEYFGESDDKHEKGEAKIFEALRHHLDRYAEKHFGKETQSAVELQIRQAERRLRFVAVEQAKRIDEGWKIHATEAAVNESDGAVLTVDGQPMGLRGRFDRIDCHEDSGEWAILDYKTHGHKPEKKHLRRNRETGKDEWIDLQLPLYRLMIPYLGIQTTPEHVQLGYFNVSDKQEETRVNIATFSEEQMAAATELIQDCVRRIHRCEFAPTDQRVQYDDYEMILQTGVASRMLAASASSSGESPDE